LIPRSSRGRAMTLQYVNLFAGWYQIDGRLQSDGNGTAHSG
jgi:hypothetical protein